MYEKRYKISARLRLAESSIHVLAGSMTALDESELGAGAEKFLNFVNFHVVLAPDFLDDLFEPDEAGYPQCADFASSGLRGSRVMWT
jgi:hypothetical protein